MSATSGHTLRDGLRAAVPATLLSEFPSTVYALLARRDSLEASVAAGSILIPREQRTDRLLVAAIPVHIILSAAWAVVLGGALPRKRPILKGTIAGLAISAIDLGIVGRRYPRIRALKACRRSRITWYSALSPQSPWAANVELPDGPDQHFGLRADRGYANRSAVLVDGVDRLDVRPRVRSRSFRARRPVHGRADRHGVPAAVPGPAASCSPTPPPPRRPRTARLYATKRPTGCCARG
jgi:hypothetical protein